MYAGAQFHSVICSRLISLFKEHFIGAVHVIRKFGDSSESARPSWVLEKNRRYKFSMCAGLAA
jgi:hypothetical protein